MKKICIAIIFVLSLLYAPLSQGALAESEKPKLAIIIDDFGGWARDGVEEMLSIDAPITCAIMPCLENTQSDMEKANECGKEIILHMPLEAHKQLPEKWYGNLYVKNCDTPEIARQKIKKGYESVQYAKGMNLHIASGVCQNTMLMHAIMEEAKARNKFFIDSFTHPKSVCQKVAFEVEVPFGMRTEFLEKTGVKSYENARQELKRIVEYAKKHGDAIAIGHVGMEGGKTTARAINDMLPYIEKSGVELCFASQIVKVQ